MIPIDITLYGPIGRKPDVLTAATVPFWAPNHLTNPVWLRLSPSLQPLLEQVAEQFEES